VCVGGGGVGQHTQPWGRGISPGCRRKRTRPPLNTTPRIRRDRYIRSSPSCPADAIRIMYRLCENQAESVCSPARPHPLPVQRMCPPSGQLRRLRAIADDQTTRNHPNEPPPVVSAHSHAAQHPSPFFGSEGQMGIPKEQARPDGAEAQLSEQNPCMPPRSRQRHSAQRAVRAAACRMGGRGEIRLTAALVAAAPRHIPSLNNIVPSNRPSPSQDTNIP